MNREKLFYNVVCTLGGGLIVLFISFVFAEPMREVGIFGAIITALSWLLCYRLMVYLPEQRERKNSSPWQAPKKVRKIKFWFDIHKSSNWEKDGQVFLCIHNEDFLRQIQSLSVLIASMDKIENGKFELALNQTAFLEKKVNVPKMKGIIDIPLLHVVKSKNIFVVREIGREPSDKDISEHEFDCGKYKMQIVFKRNDTKMDSYPLIPVCIQYEGLDKISVDICKEYPRKTMFPIVL